MIKVLQSGMYTSVQDLGRFGYRSMGIPLSGAMDAQSALLANTWVGNTPDKAVLECTLLGPTLRFTEPTTITVTGATFKLYLNTAEIEMNTVISIQQDDVLTIGKALDGMRCYVAIAGGVDTSEILGSRSFYNCVTPKAVLQRGDEIPMVLMAKHTETKHISEATKINKSKGIEVYLGADNDLLTKEQRARLLTIDFVISPQSNRMGYLLDGPHNLQPSEIITAPVQPGTVQLTPSGKVIVLMRDAQVTGGYARIFQLTDEAINQLSQKRGGDSVYFKVVDSPDGIAS